MPMMTDTVTEFPARDLIAEMTGPEQSGCSVIIDGRKVPNLVLVDHGDVIEFLLDGRLAFPFPREHAWQAAAFAFAAMAIGAGFSHPNHMHFTQRPFAPEMRQLGEIP
jgi:hypothetical protein